ncbi:hypothetical protein [Tabrizicola sp.]|uniref:hypothetical protein n=1 Tax=Tabrizicola sp. TaxID=2005166 RepID=UPI001A5BE128|nr:hypothetical protein [Tabrizicola sp.]MBL9061585.1 hypothetical protein [Tabrizicola sp.]
MTLRPLTAALALLGASAAMAQDAPPNATCRATVDAKDMMDGPCFADQSDSTVLILHDVTTNADGSLHYGQFFYLIKDGGMADVYFGEDGSSHAHDPFGTFEATGLHDGFDCYAAQRGEICFRMTSGG